jgi:uncharacterized membrane protein YfcA
MDYLAVLSGLPSAPSSASPAWAAARLMTPLLMGVFNLSPALAIGTDLWFAAITKSGGSWAHHRLGHVDYRVTGCC